MLAKKVLGADLALVRRAGKQRRMRYFLVKLFYEIRREGEESPSRYAESKMRRRQNSRTGPLRKSVGAANLNNGTTVLGQ